MTPQACEFVELELNGPVATVRLVRPPVNAVNSQMFDELRRTFSNLVEQNPGVGVVVLMSGVKHFCAGTDVSEFREMTPDSAIDRNRRVRQAFWAIYDCPVPVIAAVHGAVLGTGVAIAASCDFVIAADDAMFGLPELSVGVMGGAKHLSRLVPEGVARYMFYTSERVPAADLAQYGGIVRVVPRGELAGEVQRVARTIAEHNMVALRTAKPTLNAIEALGLKDGYEFEQGQTAILSGTAESKAVLAATSARIGSKRTNQLDP